ncbi:LmbE-like protein, partial [Wilcoxina mikolae CBS 423.85]
NANITLLIAHPDDEAMFFSPTILSLSPKNHIRILCLSSGNADNLGAIRKHELVASGRVLGVRGEDVIVVEDVLLPDSMNTTWPAETVAGYLRLNAGGSDVVVTFDEGGVSGHPNHISLLYGAREFIQGSKRRLFTLTSVGLARKYLSILDWPMTRMMNGGEGKGWVFVNSPRQVRVAQRAMTDAHKSQMRWFRWGWIGLSRYMVVNDLREEKV